MDYTKHLPPIVEVDHWTLKQAKNVWRVCRAAAVYDYDWLDRIKDEYKDLYDEHLKACLHPHRTLLAYCTAKGVPQDKIPELAKIWREQLAYFYQQLVVRKRKLKAEDREKRQNDKNELHELKAKHETLLKALEVAGVRTELVDGLYKITITQSGKT